MANLWTQVSGPGTATWVDSTSPTSAVSFTASGVYVLRLTADEGFGQGPVSDDVQITVYGPPVITTTTLPPAIVSISYNETIVAIDGLPPYTFSLLSGTLPTGLSLSSSGAVSGTPSGTPASFPFTARVTDALTQTDDQAFTLVLAGPPTITTTSLPNAESTTPYSQTLTAIEGTLPYTWSLVAGTLPTGLSLSAAGVLSGTPVGATALFPFTVRVTDAYLLTDDQPLSILLVIAPVVITTTSLPMAASGTAYSALVEAAFGVPPYTFSLFGGDLPPGLVFASSGAITGTPLAIGAIAPTTLPDAAYALPYSAQLTVTGTEASYYITVRVTDAILGTDDQDFTIPLTGLGPYTYGVVTGALPTNLSLSTAGAITGTPPAAPTPAVMLPPTLPVGVVDAAYSQPLTISGTSVPFSFTVRATIGTVSVPDQAYTVSLTSWSGTGVSWITVVSSGGPPTTTAWPKCISLGVLTGSISGKPVLVATTIVIVQATDGLGNVVEHTYTLTATS